PAPGPSSPAEPPTTQLRRCDSREYRADRRFGAELVPRVAGGRLGEREDLDGRHREHRSGGATFNVQSIGLPSASLADGRYYVHAARMRPTASDPARPFVYGVNPADSPVIRR